MASPDVRPLELSIPRHLQPAKMKTATQIQEEIAALAIEQKAAANKALVPSSSKSERKSARLDFIYLSGQIEGLRQSLADA